MPLALSYQQLVLERKSVAGWKPLAVKYPRSLGREQMRDISFTLPAGVKEGEVRVQGYRSPKFPSRFTYGKKLFARTELPRVAAPRRLDRLKTSAPEAPDPLVKGQGKEPGVWQVADNQLLYFSASRGLQVLDLSDPVNPLRTGVLRLPLASAQMFLLDETGSQVALLGRANGQGRAGAAQLFLLRIEAGAPVLIREVRLEGRMADGVLIGRHLHILTTVVDATKTRKTLLTRVDLAEPAMPKLLGKLHFAGSKPGFQVQGNRLMVAVREGAQKRLHEVAVEPGTDIKSVRSKPAKSFQLLGYEGSIQGEKLHVKSATDPLEPIMEMSLAWRTDRVLPVGDFLVQVEDGDGMSHGLAMLLPGLTADEPISRLRITPINDPDLLVEELVLGPGKVVGVSLKGDDLLVAQWVTEMSGQGSRMRTWALSLADPAAITVLDTKEQVMHGLDARAVDLARVQPLWVNAETLLWYIPARHASPPLWNWPVAAASAELSPGLLSTSSVVMAISPLHYTKGVLVAKEPRVLRVQGRVAHASAAFAETGFVFFSHDVKDEAVTLPGLESTAQVKVPMRTSPKQLRSWLQVVDFRTGEPLLRDAVSLPGQLLSVAQADAQGAVLLTQSDLSLRRDLAPTRVVQASAYDGVNVYQLTEYVTATTFNSAAVGAGTRLFLTKEMGPTGVVAIGYDPVTARLGQVSSWNTNALPTRLHVTGGHLLASSPGNLELAGIAADTGKLSAIAAYDTPETLWLQVDRAAVTPALDLWIPAGEYGVEFLQKQALGQ
ncbi:hypothetical protein [Prosthecobacter fusiformis]|uniref:hypothetical protein n=1 Tax=Prosthecobacter fusiformis TaxID=48464 RepID=UPI00105E37E7|nr:hypothetical protein [Prosthecobacter fusiformis]